MRVRVATTIVLGISVLQLKRGSKLVRFVQKGRDFLRFHNNDGLFDCNYACYDIGVSKNIIRLDTWHLEPHNTMTYSEISASFT